MKAGLQPDVSATRTVTIDRERTIDFMGEKARVYATPMLVRDIEMACRELLLQYADAGEDSVGTRVELDHVAASLMGMTVKLEIRVAKVDGRTVAFDIEGHDGIEPICRGRHHRFVVDVAKTQARLAAKAQKAGLA